MSRILQKFKVFSQLLKNGKYKYIFSILKRRMYSNVCYYFMRDLAVTEDDIIPESKINVTLRPYKESDAKYFQNLPLDDMLINANIPTCYVAVTDDDIPCFRQWLMEPKDNDKIQAFFKYNFPLLKPDECIFERVHAVKEFRGLNLMPRVLYLMRNKAVELGYKYIVGCIPVENSLSLRGLSKTNRKPYKLQVTKRRFFIRRTVYIDIPEKLKAKNPWLFSNDVN